MTYDMAGWEMTTLVEYEQEFNSEFIKFGFNFGAIFKS